MRTTGWTAGWTTGLVEEEVEVEKPLRKRLRLLSEGEAVSQRAWKAARPRVLGTKGGDGPKTGVWAKCLGVPKSQLEGACEEGRSWIMSSGIGRSALSGTGAMTGEGE